MTVSASFLRTKNIDALSAIIVKDTAALLNIVSFSVDKPNIMNLPILLSYSG